MGSVVLKDVNKSYTLGKTLVQALKNINLEIFDAEFSVIAGPSGSGKTTLLNLIGCVDVATQGRVLIQGKDTALLSDKELTSLRLQTIGFIFQTFNLISVLNVYDNIEFPLLLMTDISKTERKARVMHFIEKVGLEKFIKHRPNELSGGQRQRVAIARALVTKPKIVLADEPTANLDSVTGKNILDLMKHINETENTTFIFSTHDMNIMNYARRIIRMKDGEIVT